MFTSSKSAMSLVALGAIAFFALGCSSDDDDSNASTGGAAGGGAGGVGGSSGSGGSGATLAYHGVAKSYAAPVPPSTEWVYEGYIEGLEVCLRDSSLPCVKSAADGSFTLEGLPMNSEVALVMSHPDYMGRMVSQYVTYMEDEYHTLPLLSTKAFNAYVAGSGCTVPPQKGTGLLYIGAPPGSKVVLTPKAPIGPVHSKADGTFDPALTEISAQAPIQLAAAVACGLPPGTYQLDIEGDVGNCEMIEGWPGDGHDIEVIIEADSSTVTNWICN